MEKIRERQTEKEILLREEAVGRGPLILVNRTHPLREGDTGLRLEAADPLQPEILLEAKTAALLRQLRQAAGDRGELTLVSGYRSREEQVQIYEESLRDNGPVFTACYVAVPDCSEHQTGLAVDLAKHAKEIDFIRPDFPETGICGIFRRLAARYGFVERYGKEKEEVTGISYEPWHFRYVGYPHSAVMKEKGLCLEEYHAYLKQFRESGEHLLVREQSKEIEIFYVPAAGEETRVTLPENGICQVSGNNEDGFILTVWRQR